MTRTTGRTLQLLSLLQAGRCWSGAELCERLRISSRTLRRDVDDLRGQGYGIDAVPGVGGGYRLGAGASIPPLTLSVDEAIAIAVGLRASAFSVITGIEDASMRALAKLEQSLSSSAHERIAVIESAIVPLAAQQGDAVEMTVLSAVAAAIRASRELHIDYRRHDGSGGRRVVRPHRIVRTTDRWYLIARYRDDPTWRTLRLDRVEPHEPLGRSFVPAALDDDEVRVLTGTAIAVAPYPVQVRLLLDAAASEVSRRFGPEVAEVTACDGETSMLRTGGPSFDEIAAYVTAAGFRFDVLERSDLDIAE